MACASPFFNPITMKPISSILLAVLSLAMIVSLKLPLWDIQLDAPQYPEGLDMKIWLDHISGDVGIINGLNHYIGMDKIKDEMFPEFGYMKKVLVVVIGVGLLVALLRKRALYYLWFASFLAIAVVGMYDFWSWEYKYGHHLDPHAAINIPGMSYQPPLIGCKDLLNFTACSFPDTGGWIIVGAGSLAFFICIFEIVAGRKKTGV